jgi:hypothetical protein
MTNRKMPGFFLVFCLVLGFLSVTEAFSAVRPPDRKPQWWLRDGICFVGNWEPLVFRVRRGPIPTNYLVRYEWEHSNEAISALKAAGVNMIVTHFYKGLGLQHEKKDLVYTRKLVETCKHSGLFVGAYIGSTLFSETLYQEIPQSEQWKQVSLSGEVIRYSSSQYFRDRADFTIKGYREHIKSIVTKAIKEYGMDLIHFDNISFMFSSQAGRTDNIQKQFRRYLKEKYDAEQLEERMGFPDISMVSPPNLQRNPMLSVTDPLFQEWTYFRVEALADYVEELSEHIRSLDSEVIVETNPQGLCGRNRALETGMDHARQLPFTDIFWSEDPDHARYFPEETRLVSKIRSYKLARHFANALFSYSNNPLEIAEAAAFNRMCLGDAGYRVLENWPEGVNMDDSYRYYYTDDTLDREKKARNRKYIQFFHQNKDLFRGLEVVADVGVMRDFESMTFGGWHPHLNTIQAEQALIQSRVPFEIIFEQDWEKLDRYKVVVLASQENLSNSEIARLRRYVHQGGCLAVVGRTGAYDQYRKLRGLEDDFWRLLGAESVLKEPEKTAKMTLGRGRIYYLPGFENHPKVPEISSQVHPDYWHLPLNWEQFMEGLHFCMGGEFTVTVETRLHVAAAHYRKGVMRQVHLVNYWPGHPARYIPVIFSEHGLAPEKATLYSPDHLPLPLDLNRYREGWLVLVPEVETYGIIVLQ